MLGRRRRRRANIKTTLAQRLVFAGKQLGHEMTRHAVKLDIRTAEAWHKLIITVFIDFVYFSLII